ncbi:MAG: hypothetical protein A3J74_09735 [Elusimicrobia bacterium RIFCSPHIGHO2_02_FULL_57_9]|nr:MAG: hypothetical protein A3J74_09735 [Elusimicrobia bacterium RIFCSPHIGHO2_02_FULL_57_9]
MKRRSLAFSLLIWVLPVSLIIVIAASYSTYRLARSLILYEAQQGIMAITDAAAAQVKGFFQQRSNDIAIIRQSPLFKDHFTNVEYGLRQEAGVYLHEIERMLCDFSRRAGVYPRLSYLDGSGKPLCLIENHKPARLKGEFEDPEFFAALKSLSGTYHPIFRQRRVAWHHAPIIRYGVPVKDEAGRLRGALIFDCSLSPMYEFLGRLHLGISGRAVLAERKGRLGDRPPFIGADLLIAESIVPGTPWSVVMVVKRSDFVDRLTAISSATLFLAFFAAVMLILLITRQIRLLLRPLSDLENAAIAYAQGDLGVRVNISKPREVATLGEAFNLMADSLRQRTEALIQTEKMSVVGNLIAGVAHELNNPLAAVIGFAELLKDLPAKPEEQEDLRHLHSSALRCRDIVQGLLLFVRRDKTAQRRVSLNEAVKSTLALFEYRLVKTEGVKLEVDLDPDCPYIAADFQKIQQVLVNLTNNAADAVKEHPGPRIVRIRTGSLGAGAEFEIEDTGPGVSQEKRRRIFEPFYTTKPVGKGTGLGLSISAQIVSEFGGTLRCEQGPEGGARFAASFPPCSPDMQEMESSAGLPPSFPGRRVLVVDDEPELVQLMLRLLREDGLVAAAAMDPKDACRQVRGGGFDLVVADIDMGEFKGTQLTQEARHLINKPEFVFVTGDILNQDLIQELVLLNMSVLAKPFLRTEFLRMIRRALELAAYQRRD